MIFVTVGTQLPFDRLVKAIDTWASSHPEEEIVIQSGGSAYTPLYCKVTDHIPPSEWESLFQRADIIVSHAGMGTILKSLDYGKSLIIMPRLSSLGEHRNDHQVATAKRFKDFSSITVASTEEELIAALNNPNIIQSDHQKDNPNLTKLISALQTFIHEHP